MQTWMNFKNGHMEVRLLALYGEYAIFRNTKTEEHVVAWLPEFGNNEGELTVSWAQGHYLNKDYNSAVDFWKEKVGFVPPAQADDVNAEDAEEVIGVIVPITREQLSGCLEDAFIGGNYWCGLDNREESYKDARQRLIDSTGEDRQYLGDICAEVLLHGDTLVIYDMENPKERWHLGIKPLLSALAQVAVEDESWVLDTSMDEVLQIALFGSVQYA